MIGSLVTFKLEENAISNAPLFAGQRTAETSERVYETKNFIGRIVRFALRTVPQLTLSLRECLLIDLVLDCSK